MKIKTQIQCSFLCLALIAVFITGVSSYLISKQGLEKETHSYLTTLNNQKASRIKLWIRSTQGHLEGLSQLSVERHEFPDVFFNENAGRYVPAEFRKRLLKDHLRPKFFRRDFNELFILRPSDGVVLFSTDYRQQGKTKERHQYYQEGYKNTYIENPFYSLSINKTTMVISTPLKDAGNEKIAILAGRLNLHNLTSITESYSGRKQTEDTYLVNRQNHFMTEPQYGNNYALHKTVFTEGVNRALKFEDSVGRYENYRGVPVVGAFQYLPEVQMALISEIGLDEFLAPVRIIQNSILGIATGIFILALLMGWVISSAVFRPLKDLIAKVDRIDSQNLEFDTEETGDNEIVRLSGSFKAMTQRLKQSLVSRNELIQEIEHRTQSEKQLQTTLNQLQQSNKELEQFAYVASHDLQEPLRMVSSYTQLLATRYQGQLDEKADKYIYFATDGANRMQMLIEDLLAFSRVTTRGREFSPIEINSVLYLAKKNLEVAIKERNALITNDDLPTIKCDGPQLVQVFQNLISNAVKFCENEQPRIHISASEQNNMWRFSVEDNGIGISEKYADRIFVIFQRLHSREHYSGTGIGLAICKRIAERHGGNIWFESEEGQGTTFYFTINTLTEENKSCPEQTSE